MGAVPLSTAGLPQPGRCPSAAAAGSEAPGPERADTSRGDSSVASGLLAVKGCTFGTELGPGSRSVLGRVLLKARCTEPGDAVTQGCFGLVFQVCFASL